MIRPPSDRRLRPVQRGRLSVEIVIAFLATARELRRGPIDQVVARLRGPSARVEGPASAFQLWEAMRLGYAVDRVFSYLPGDTRCLRRSLVLLRLLSRRGIPARLVIAARSGPDFLAHAWLEYDGYAILPAGDSSFGRLVEL